jgi:hypothetical protein
MTTGGAGDEERANLPLGPGVTRDESPDIDDVVGTRQDDHEAEADIRTPRAVPYDPARDREKVRGRVVYALIALLMFLVIGPLVAIWRGSTYGDMEPFLTLVFGSVTTLVGSAIGFYFGERKR